MSNKNLDTIAVSKTTVSTAEEDELPFLVDSTSNNNNLNKSPSSVQASTKYACCSQRQAIISRATSITTESEDKISTGESYGQEEDEEITTVIDDKSISTSSNSTSNSGTGTTDKYSSRNSVNINQQQRSDDEYGLQLQKTTEYSSLARESKVRDNIKNYYDNDGDHNDDEIDENDDGFQTPTSLDHKIPEIRPCPPPPRKSPMVLLASNTTTTHNEGSSSSSSRRCSKRKLSEDGTTAARISRGRLLLDLSNEVESMFPSVVKDNLGRKIRKARSA